MSKIIEILRDIFSNLTILIILFVALVTLLIDGKKFKDQDYIKEMKIVKAISYSYIAIGIIMFLFLKIV